MKQTKVVQTEVGPEIHARLGEIARRRKVPLKAVVREALAHYADRDAAAWEQDPILGMIGRVQLDRRDWSERKDWRP